MSLCLEMLDKEFAVCRLTENSIPETVCDFLFYAKTDEEVSLVCPEENIPASCLECEKGWRAMRVTGTLDFSLIGIISKYLKSLRKTESAFLLFPLTTPITY